MNSRGRFHCWAIIPAASAWTSVTFGSTGASKTMDLLSSWTDDEATKYFSGVAVYEKTVSIPESMLKTGMTQIVSYWGRAWLILLPFL